MPLSKNWLRTVAATAASAIVILASSGCQHWKMFYQRPTFAPVGTINDAIWQQQEINAEMSDFIVHVHDFRQDSEFLNRDGEDHLRSIAARLRRGQNAIVVVERTQYRPKENTEFKYPIHFDPQLDLRRREIIVRLLGAMGIADADQRVVVAPRFDHGFLGPEAERSLERGPGGGGFGGFFFGGGGMGGGTGR
jgi:hypothetical protein